MNWWDTQEPEVTWLVDGLFPADGYSGLSGKPKAGKSTACRQLAVCVVKSRPFLGRSINLPAGTGRALYIHLDRKDRKHKVVAEFKQLGMTQQESARLRLLTAEDLPSNLYEQRLAWLQKEIIAFKPHLVVIDLMWQFVDAKNPNAYKEVLDGINKLQDALTEAHYKGALVVTMHARKQTNQDDPADDILGSTGQRGSFSTLLLFSRNRKQNYYTVMSDQTERDEVYGEIDETIVTRSADGMLVLGSKVSDLRRDEHKQKEQENLRRVLQHVREHPGCTQEGMIEALRMSKARLLGYLEETAALMTTRGGGVKGDPLRYYFNGAAELAHVDQAGSQSSALDPATQDTGTELQAVVIAKVRDDKELNHAEESVEVLGREPLPKLPVEVSPTAYLQPNEPASAEVFAQNSGPSATSIVAEVNKLKLRRQLFLQSREECLAKGNQQWVDRYDKYVAETDARLLQLHAQA